MKSIHDLCAEAIDLSLEYLLKHDGGDIDGDWETAKWKALNEVTEGTTCLRLYECHQLEPGTTRCSVCCQEIEGFKELIR